MSRTRDDVVGVVAHREKLSPDDADVLRAALDASNLRVAWTDIDKGPLATKATRKLVEKGVSNVVACGGDGTVRASAEALVSTGIPLSVVPAGTANLFCAALELPHDVQEIVATLRGGTNRVLDVGRCNGLAFIIMAGTGLDARMIDGADESKGRIGRAAYLVSGARAARSLEKFPVKVKVDGKRLFKGDASCVLVANIGRVMGGIDAVPGAQPDDGRLDIAVVTAEGMTQWSNLVWHALRGDQMATGLVQLGSGERITVQLDRKRRFELDGGSKGSSRRLDVDLVRGGLVVRTPRTAAA